MIYYNIHDSSHISNFKTINQKCFYSLTFLIPHNKLYIYKHPQSAISRKKVRRKEREKNREQKRRKERKKRDKKKNGEYKREEKEDKKRVSLFLFLELILN